MDVSYTHPRQYVTISLQVICQYHLNSGPICTQSHASQIWADMHPVTCISTQPSYIISTPGRYPPSHMHFNSTFLYHLNFGPISTQSHASQLNLPISSQLRADINSVTCISTHLPISSQIWADIHPVTCISTLGRYAPNHVHLNSPTYTISIWADIHPVTCISTLGRYAPIHVHFNSPTYLNSGPISTQSHAFQLTYLSQLWANIHPVACISTHLPISTLGRYPPSHMHFNSPSYIISTLDLHQRKNMHCKSHAYNIPILSRYPPNHQDSSALASCDTYGLIDTYKTGFEGDWPDEDFGEMVWRTDYVLFARSIFHLIHSQE